MKIYQSCSPFLSPYLLQVFGDLDISEKTATCHDCLCSRPERKNLPFYQKHLKCCTFHPFLPNYEVGAILASEDVGYEAKEVVRQKIQRREYALPLGVFAPVSYQVAFNQREPADFGNKESFLCPYFDRKKRAMWNLETSGFGLYVLFLCQRPGSCRLGVLGALGRLPARL